MVAGGALSSLIIIPVINIWGQSQGAPVFPETELLIRDMTSSQIWDRYIRYIGAGAVATAGIITGSFVVETIFNIPGMGRMFVLGAFNRDYTLILGLVVFFALLVVLFNALVDILLGLLNPKLRMDS